MFLFFSMANQCCIHQCLLSLPIILFSVKSRHYFPSLPALFNSAHTVFQVFYILVDMIQSTLASQNLKHQKKKNTQNVLEQIPHMFQSTGFRKKKKKTCACCLTIFIAVCLGTEIASILYLISTSIWTSTLACIWQSGLMIAMWSTR